MRYERRASFRRKYLTIVAGAAAIAAVGSVLAALLSPESVAAPTVAPSNVTQPAVTGTTQVGQVLRTSRGTWTGSRINPARPRRPLGLAHGVRRVRT